MQIINAKESGAALQEAIISPAFRYGQGFFTTTRIINYVPLWLNEHMKRLNDSLDDFSMGNLDERELAVAATRWPCENAIKDGFLRIMVWAQGEEVQVFIKGGKLNNTTKGPAELTLAPYSRHSLNPLLGYKSFNYWLNNLAYSDAVKDGYYDAIFLNESGDVCETSRCNIFWARGEVLYTPEPECGLLKGIGRDKISDLASKLGIKVIQGRFHTGDLEQADEVFLTNSVRGIISISSLQKGHFYNPEGLVIKKLTRAYDMLIKEYLQTFENV
ncbi:MAG: aminotransferase class IV [Syntrophomonadaceae bacterium]|nr:aminotransferase class IV [Syntrophomonadaceae bacterium]MDD3889997.1 aminotransferase class IV [Syntrophomonadaceae bacterium]